MSLRRFKVGVLLKLPQGLSVDPLGSLKGVSCGQCPPPPHHITLKVLLAPLSSYLWKVVTSPV